MRSLLSRCIFRPLSSNLTPKIYKTSAIQVRRISDSSGYDGDGKTVVNVINQDEHLKVLIDSYAKMGFRLNSGIFVIGPIAVFSNTVLQWDVATVADINVHSLSLFWLLEPKIDLLVIGVGDAEMAQHFDESTRLFFKEKKINLEVMATSHAVPTFNFMNSDFRNAAGAFIPPKKVALIDTADAMAHYNLRKGLYKETTHTEDDIKRQWRHDKELEDEFQRRWNKGLTDHYRNKKY